MKPYKWKRDVSIGVSDGNKSAAMPRVDRRRTLFTASAVHAGFSGEAREHLDVELTKKKFLKFNFP